MQSQRTLGCALIMMATSIANAQPPPQSPPTPPSESGKAESPPTPAVPDANAESILQKEVETARARVKDLEASIKSANDELAKLKQAEQAIRNTASAAHTAAAKASDTERAKKQADAATADRGVAAAGKAIADLEIKRRSFEDDHELAKDQLYRAEQILRQQQDLEKDRIAGTSAKLEEDRIKLVRSVGQEIGASSLQQLTSARGGTLGIPSTAPVEGFQAGLDAQLLDGQGADLFAQLGGIDISPRVVADAFGEVAKFDLSRRVVSMDGSIVGDEFPAAQLSMAGLRVRVRVRDALLVSSLQKSACLNDILRLKRARTPQEATTFSQDAVASCDRDAIGGRTTVDLALGTRIVRRSPLTEDGGHASDGGAVETMATVTHWTPYHSWQFSVGGSALRLSKANDKLGDQTILFPKLTMARAFVGFEFRGSIVRDMYDALPRLGAYATYTRAWWDEAPESWARHEAEFGVYLGGRFQKKFQGMLVARVLNPFGEDGATFILSVVPSGNTSPEEAARSQ